MSKPDELIPAINDSGKSLLKSLMQELPISDDLLQSVFADDVFTRIVPQTGDSDKDKIEFVAKVLGIPASKLKKDYKHFCRAREELHARYMEQQREEARLKHKQEKRKEKQRQKHKPKKPANIPAAWHYRPKVISPPLVTETLPEPVVTVPEPVIIAPEPIIDPEVSMLDLRLDFSYRDKPLGKQPEAIDRATIGVALAIDAGKTQIDEVYDFLTERLGLDDYIDSMDSYYQDTSGLLRVIRKQLTSAGYILVDKEGTVQLTPEGFAKLKSMNGKATDAGVKIEPAPPQPIPEQSAVSTIDASVEITKLRDCIAECQQLLTISAEEEAIHAAAVQGMNAQIPDVKKRLEQVQRELDTLIRRKNAVEEKVAQSKKEQDDLRREIEFMTNQVDLLSQS